MTFTIYPKTLSELFAGQTIYEIPFFQRNYTWQEENYNQFLQDIRGIDKEYFMGSIILKQKPQDENVRIVIDGQQRLTTIILLCKALLKDEDRVFKTFFCSQRGTKDDAIALRHNRYDREIFEAIVNSLYRQDNREYEKYEKNRLLKCYRFFREDKNIKDLDYRSLLYKIKFISIELTQEEDEQTFFETTNSRECLLLSLHY